MSILDTEQSARYIDSLVASVQALEADLAATRDKLRQAEGKCADPVCERCLMNPAHICIGCHQLAERVEAPHDYERSATRDTLRQAEAECRKHLSRENPNDLIGLIRDMAQIMVTAKGNSDEAMKQLEQAQARIAALEKELSIMSLAVPLEEDLSARIDEMLKYLAMEQGFTLSGIAQLLVEVQRRMADDWMVIGRERSRRIAAEANARGREEER